MPLGIDIEDSTSLPYRALIFVNGWQMGIYANELGPQRTFPVPPGILNPNGINTIAIAVPDEQGGANGIGSSGGVPVQLVPAPQVSW